MVVVSDDLSEIRYVQLSSKNATEFFLINTDITQKYHFS